jgi:hypothetical protein
VVSEKRPGEKSFGISRLDSVAVLNVHRLIYRDADVGWNIVTSHLLLVQHWAAAPTAIRQQACDVLDHILIIAPRNITTGGEELQRRIQTQVLEALASQAESDLRTTTTPQSQTSTDIGIRRGALETLFKILEVNGHSFVCGWERVFGLLRSACPSDPDRALSAEEAASVALQATQVSSARTPVLVRASFPSLQLICTDFLGSLNAEELRLCVSTLADYGKQPEDVNVALTVRNIHNPDIAYRMLVAEGGSSRGQAGGLLWQVSDHLQARCKQDTSREAEYRELWMYLLIQLLYLCRDARQEVRDGAIQTLFRTLEIYGSTLDEQAWDRCLWEIVFPLFDWLNLVIGQIKSQGVPSLPARNGDVDEGDDLVPKQWDASKILALSSTASVFTDFFSPKLVHTAKFRETWTNYLGQLRDAFVRDTPTVATAAMECFERLLRSSVKAELPDDDERVKWAWEEAWRVWDDLGSEVLRRANDSSKDHFSQGNLAAFVRVVNPIQARLALGLARCRRLLEIIRGALTYARSQDYRTDIDSLSPVQAAVLDTIDAIDLEADVHLPAAVLSDLAEYTTLAFVAAFDVDTLAYQRRTAPTQTVTVTYIALFKAAMPRVLQLYGRFKDRAAVYNDGAVETVLAVGFLALETCCAAICC